MNNIVFGIPSYKRVETISTVDYLLEMGVEPNRIFVSTQTEDDFSKYKEKLQGKCAVIYGEGSCVSDNRNNLLNHFEKGTKLVMLDDDLFFIGYLKGKNIEPFEKDKLHSFLNDAFEYAEKNCALIWTGYPAENGFFMSNTIDKRNFGVGCIMGIIIDDYRFDREFKIKEDFELCLHTIRDGYNCIRFNFIHAKGRHKTNGGCMEFWDNNEDAKCTRKILLKYPNLIKKGTKENSIIMKKKGK